MGAKEIVCITTYNRQHEVKALVSKLKTIFSGKIIVFDDGSNPPSDPGCEVILYHKNNGKKGYHKLVTEIFKWLKNENFTYFWMLPDDIIPHDDLFTHSVQIWEAIKDERKICLSVGHTHGRHYLPCWTYFTPVRLGDVVLTGWNDLCFMAEKKFLEELNYEIEPPYSDYDWRSSGVGRNISRRLQPYWNMYHVDKSLCDFPANKSVMHT